MRRIRGTKEELTLVQFCNGWFMAESATNPNVIVRPTQVELAEDEKDHVCSNQDTGTLFREFELYEHAPGVWRFRTIAS